MVNLCVSRVLALVFAARGPALACAHQGGAGYLQQHDDSHIALHIDAEGSVQPAAGIRRVSEASKAAAPTRRLTVTSEPLNSFGHGGDSTHVASTFGSGGATDVLLKDSVAGDAAQVRPAQIRRVSSNPTSGSVPIAGGLARRLSIETMPLNSFGHSGDSEHFTEIEAPASVHEEGMAEVRPAGIARGSESPDGGSTAEMGTRPRSLIIQTVPLNSFGHGGHREAKNEAPHQYARTARDEATGRSGSMVVAGLFVLGLTTLGCAGAHYSRTLDHKAADDSRKADPKEQKITIT